MVNQNEGVIIEKNADRIKNGVEWNGMKRERNMSLLKFDSYKYQKKEFKRKISIQFTNTRNYLNEELK